MRRPTRARRRRSRSRRVGELLPLQSVRRDAIVQRVEKTFLFTDIVGSTNLAEALGDEAWEALLRWHDENLRALFVVHHGQEVVTTGDGFFVGFDSPADAIGCAVAIQRRLDQQRREHGFAPQVRIGVHHASAQQVEGNYRGKGVHEAARIAAVAVGQRDPREPRHRRRQRSSGCRSRDRSQLKGLSEPMEVVSVAWK